MMFLAMSVLPIIFTCISSYKNPHYQKDRSVMVHLFEWKWKDIADECERFLGPNGYAGVQISPPSENMIRPGRPWWERYQPVSYKIATRSGNESEFADMVTRCNNVGIRIYADVIINHMSGNGGTVGTGGTISNPIEKQFPGVPYGPLDFNSDCGIVDYNDPIQVRNCKLVGLNDLNQGMVYVREKIIDYLNNLIDMGVAGFRIDAAKHMWPNELNIIYDSLKNVNTHQGFSEGSRPYIYQEVIDLGGESISKSEYTTLAAITESKFSEELGNAFRGNNALKWLISWGPKWSLAPSEDALVFIDNHDNQRSGGNILTYKQAKQYKGAIAFALAHPYGEPRIMSSFFFENSDSGPPHDANDNIISPTINPDITCGNGWVCEHRWRQIYQMVAFRNAVKGSGINDWWDNGNNQIAFCRGQRGFIAINNEGKDFKQWLQTCLPGGLYCDVISGLRVGNKCTGKNITVDEDGKAHFDIPSWVEDMHIVIHVGQESQIASDAKKSKSISLSNDAQVGE